jgi:uncharacterized protein
MLVLLGFGLFHGYLIWSGDILVSYALLGLLLLPFRDLSQRALATIAAAIWMVLPYVMGKVLFLLEVQQPRFTLRGAQAIYASGTFSEIARLRIQDTLQRTLRDGFNEVASFSFFVLLLLGMLAARHGVLSRLSGQNPSWLRRALGAALVWTAIGICFEICPISFLESGREAAGWQDPLFWSPRDYVISFLQESFVLANTVVYALVLVALYRRAGWAARLAPLAAVGRMTLTTYLLQSILSTTLFYGYGFALWGKVGRWGILAMTIAIFIAQMAGSTYWLRRFRFGPAEWLWRSLAYARPQPMSQRKPESG